MGQEQSAADSTAESKPSDEAAAVPVTATASGTAAAPAANAAAAPKPAETAGALAASALVPGTLSASALAFAPRQESQPSAGNAEQPGRPTRSAPPPLQGQESDESSSEDEEARANVFKNLELGPDGNPSMGSAGHNAGECKRCCFFPKARCSNGYQCRFCHFEHEKRKRLKKKKSKSANPTPSGTHTGSLLSPVVGDGYMGHAGILGMQPPTPLSTTPMGGLMMPMSPSAPPELPPALNGISAAETPPPPSVEAAPSIEREGDAVASPQRAVATEAPEATATSPSGEALTAEPSTGVTGASSVPTSPGSVTGSAAGLSGKPVTLTDLLSTTASAGSQPATPAASASPGLPGASPSSPQLAPAADSQLPLWPPQGIVPQLPGGYPANPWATNYWNPYDTSGVVQNQWAGLYSHPVESTLLPPPLPGVLPGAAYAGGEYQISGYSASLEKDSPRSALLTMCGAWGALKAPKAEGDQLLPGAISKIDLLRYRRTAPKGCPKHLKTLRAVAKRHAEYY